MPEQPDSGLRGLRFAMVDRYSASAAPTTDFAYVRWGEDGPNREGKIMRFRILAASRRAREALLNARLFESKHFWPVRMVAPPASDSWRDESVLPMYSPAELAALRRREAELFPR